MTGADIRRYSTDRRGLALNVVAGVAGAALAALAEGLILPSLVLAYFVGQLDTSTYPLVGFVPAIGVAVWSLARLPAAVLVGPQRRKLPWAIGASLVRAAAMALLALLCFRAGEGSDAQLMRAFFICYTAYAFASGFAAVPVARVLDQAIPHEGRELFFRQRAVWSGLAGILGGLVVAQLLADAAPEFPRNFALLFLAATVCLTATTFFVAMLREPLRLSAARPTSKAATLAAAPRTLTDANFRRFLAFRLLLSLSSLADPFLVIFAASQLDVPDATIGGYVVALLLGRLATTPLWAGLQRRRGEKAVLQVAALVRLLAPMLALLVPYLQTADPIRDRIGDRGLDVLFGLAFLAIGAAMGGQGHAAPPYLAEIAPARLRSAYGALTNSLLVAVAFAPVLGGVLIERWDFPALFTVAALIGLIAVFASGALTDTHVRTRPTAEAWRLRRPADRGIVIPPATSTASRSAADR